MSGACFNIDIIFGALKALARLRGSISKLAKYSNIERASVYKAVAT
jgi:DNA-binding phage protein